MEMTHVLVDKPSVFRLAGSAFEPFMDKIRYYWISKDHIRAMMGKCMLRGVVGCGWDRWSMVHLMYRLVAKGLYDARPGDAVVTNADADEIVHRRTLLRLRHCANGTFAHHLNFVNLWYNFNCMERPHRQMKQSVTIWTEPHWPAMWQWWYGDMLKGIAGSPMTLDGISDIIGLPAGHPAYRHEYVSTHRCRFDCPSIAAAAANPEATRKSCEEARRRLLYEKHFVKNFDIMPECPYKIIKDIGGWSNVHPKQTTVVVPNRTYDLSWRRKSRKYFGYDRDARCMPRPPSAEELAGLLRDNGGWHLSYFGGPAAVLQHSRHKAHRRDHHGLTEAVARQHAQQCSIWLPGAVQAMVTVDWDVTGGARGAGARALLPHHIAANAEHYTCRGWLRRYPQGAAPRTLRPPKALLTPDGRCVPCKSARPCDSVT
eukprot:TRINITY_DN22202_c0_g1_i1.p1 TRINITY_DN22202_c0_g1~~TRINITY_DN22202_c0_g1_i1.p1  ORF type:complete len:428 (+),score=111.62 TRINITY_DN22202_c0_g1_i1:674-1957(+)